MLSSRAQAHHLIVELAMPNGELLVFAKTNHVSNPLCYVLKEGTAIPDDPPGMNQTWNPAQDGQADVDEEIGAATTLEEDGQLEDRLATRVSRVR